MHLCACVYLLMYACVYVHACMCVCVSGFYKYSGFCQATYVVCVFVCVHVPVCVQNVYILYVQSVRLCTGEYMKVRG